MGSGARATWETAIDDWIPTWYVAGGRIVDGLKESLLRVVGCILVSLAGIALGAYMLLQRVDVPPVYWVLCTLAVVGVAGADVLRAVLNYRARNGGPQ